MPKLSDLSGLSNLIPRGSSGDESSSDEPAARDDQPGNPQRSTSKSVESDDFNADLRELFEERAATDPELDSLLEGVEPIEAQDLLAEPRALTEEITGKSA